MGTFPEWQHRSRSRRGWMLAASGVVLALIAGGCSSPSSSPSAGAPVKGGTAVMAEPPSQTPSYIFPFMAPSVSTNQNLFDFTYLMYRPLYWFGNGAQPTLNTSLSLADPATFSGTKVTITLKHYMWSNGAPVAAQDVVFWINMMRAVPQDWFGSVPGGFPTNVADVRAVSATELTMTMKKSYSPTWFLYNNLSQITPMPAAWDRTASGPSSCATTVSDCAAVYNYLAGQAKDLSSYATSPIWSIVDGPWKLSAFNADGHVTFVPNKSYSGPVKPHLAQLQEVPFTTDSAEHNVMQSPNSGTKIDVGYIPAADLPPKPPGAAVGTNPLSAKGYTLTPLYAWGMGFYVMNFQSTTGNGPVIRQLYFRQAMAYLMDQQGVISGPLRGYGAVTVGPVGNVPVTKFLSPKGRQGDPFPFSIAKAKALLSSHVLQSRFPARGCAVAERYVLSGCWGYIRSPPFGRSWLPGRGGAGQPGTVVVPAGGCLVLPSPGGPAQREGEAGAGDQPGGVLRGEAGEAGGLGDRQPDGGDARRAGLPAAGGDGRVAEGDLQVSVGDIGVVDGGAAVVRVLAGGGGQLDGAAQGASDGGGPELGEGGQGGVPADGVEGAGLALVPAEHVLARSVRFRCRPAPPGDGDEVGHGGGPARRRPAQTEGVLVRAGDQPADEQVLAVDAGGGHSPVAVSRALGPVPA